MINERTGAKKTTQKFGAKLRYLRRFCDLTQAEVTQRLGFSAQTYISNLEKGRKMPSFETVVKVADLFRVSMDYLLRDEIPIHVMASSDLPHNHHGRHRRWCGERMRSLRTRLGWSQAELSRQLNLAAPSYLSNLELGRQEPSISVLLGLAEVLAVSTDEFLQEVNEE